MTELTETSPPDPATPSNLEVEAKPETEVQKPIDWMEEFKGIVWLLLAVLGFHSLVAKPFYIPSESMLPILRVGDRLVVTKFPYGYSYVSPTFHLLPFIKGRIFPKMPERGDIAIVLPNGGGSDYIKRVIGLPGDRIEVHNGVVILNGTPVERATPKQRLIPVDANTQCKEDEYPGLLTRGPDGHDYCQLLIIRETLPNGVSYDTVEMGFKPSADEFGPITVPDDHVFMMGDNRDNSADSRFSLAERGLGGPVPIENLGGRAEFVTFSLDGTSSLWNPISWITAMRSGRSGISLRPDKSAPRQKD